MYELLYMSMSPDGFFEPELKELLQQARLKNNALGVTGMLVYCGWEFIQILEGEEDVVKDLYQTIFNDPRHRSVEVFYQGAIQQRAFTGWSMAFQVFDESDLGAHIIDYEKHNPHKSPMKMIKDNPNRGKAAFLSLRNTL